MTTHAVPTTLRLAAVLAALLVMLAGCGGVAAPAVDLTSRPINALATTGMVGDLVRNVGGERVQVTTLMGAGVDPHLYKPSAGDVRRLSSADIIFFSGLDLEGRMAELFEKLDRADRPAIAVTRDLDPAQLLPSADYADKYDPHVWFDVLLWSEGVHTVAAGLSALDPGSQELYQRNASAYLRQLHELHSYALAQIASLPPEARVLITAHDAFGYFGARYGLEVRGLQGISTAAEAGAADVQDLAALLVERRIKAVFIESSVPQATIEAVQAAARARGWDVAIGGELFSDAMGNAGTTEGTYIGMVRHNVDTIVGALK
ncbi:MAG TPA: zinc ABC transporter substrate-binding protein [Roseiflexaceae bacterium]|nr:zinc ABC transporter substrate-binding protein [Roseiflexaceae bacterium]